MMLFRIVFCSELTLGSDATSLSAYNAVGILNTLFFIMTVSALQTHTVTNARENHEIITVIPKDVTFSGK